MAAGSGISSPPLPPSTVRFPSSSLAALCGPSRRRTRSGSGALPRAWGSSTGFGAKPPHRMRCITCSPLPSATQGTARFPLTVPPRCLSRTAHWACSTTAPRRSSSCSWTHARPAAPARSSSGPLLRRSARSPAPHPRAALFGFVHGATRTPATVAAAGFPAGAAFDGAGDMLRCPVSRGDLLFFLAGFARALGAAVDMRAAGDALLGKGWEVAADSEPEGWQKARLLGAWVPVAGTFRR
ncbi:hypothetical protein DFJ74DRAFT_692893 [Hyaloraphidium curvatum]|nr:hypothetical protein DFJ74DRAFT_692893 [Hyaloraphidium curvatum]